MHIHRHVHFREEGLGLCSSISFDKWHECEDDPGDDMMYDKAIINEKTQITEMSKM